MERRLDDDQWQLMAVDRPTVMPEVWAPVPARPNTSSVSVALELPTDPA
jgi:hypothetical protein